MIDGDIEIPIVYADAHFIQQDSRREERDDDHDVPISQPIFEESPTDDHHVAHAVMSSIVSAREDQMHQNVEGIPYQSGLAQVNIDEDLMTAPAVVRVDDAAILEDRKAQKTIKRVYSMCACASFTVTVAIVLILISSDRDGYSGGRFPTTPTTSFNSSAAPRDFTYVFSEDEDRFVPAIRPFYTDVYCSIESEKECATYCGYYADAFLFIFVSQSDECIDNCVCYYAMPSCVVNNSDLVAAPGLLRSYVPMPNETCSD